MKKGNTKRAKKRSAKSADVPTSAKRVRLLRKAMPDVEAVTEEMRRHAAEWVAAIRARIMALSAEVNRVLQQTKRGTVLGRVLDPWRLSEVGEKLDGAECSIAALDVEGYDMPIPGLLAKLSYFCELFPHAVDGAKLLGEQTGDEP